MIVCTELRGLVIFLLLGVAACVVDIQRTGFTRVHFQYQIDNSLFFSDSSPQIKYTSSVLNLPDLPAWLKLEQKTPSDPAFLYGTPPESAIGEVLLEIIGWNKKDYSTAKKTMRITIEKISLNQVKYQMDFKIDNFDLKDFLGKSQGDKFLEKARKIWPNFDQVTKIDKVPDRPGGRFPLPGKKEMVYVTISSSSPLPSNLRNAQYCSGAPKPGSKAIYDNFPPEFVVDWCKVALITLTPAVGSQTGSQTSESFGFTNQDFSTVAYNPRARNTSTELMIIFVPILIGILFIVVLTYLMCCKREGVEKRDATTPRDQLRHHRSLRRAAYNMREMNNKDRTKSPNGAFPYGPLDEEPYMGPPKTPTDHGASPPPPGTPTEPPRSAAPPPYRLPPPMPSDQASDTESLPPGPPPYQRQ